MPIYEYCCQECGHSLEALQKLADAPLTDCPACSATGFEEAGQRTFFPTLGRRLVRDRLQNRRQEKHCRRAQLTRRISLREGGVWNHLWGQAE